jgi:hypothetical protein
MSPPLSSSSQKDSATARVLGSAFAGILELLGFHPVDTVAKRLMNNPNKVCHLSFFSYCLSRLDFYFR